MCGHAHIIAGNTHILKTTPTAVWAFSLQDFIKILVSSKKSKDEEIKNWRTEMILADPRKEGRGLQEGDDGQRVELKTDMMDV